MAINTNIQESEYEAKLRQAVAVLPWGHTLTLMRKFGDDDKAMLYYAQEIISKGWNRELLSCAITLKMHLKKNEILDNNFKQTLPATQAMFANEVFKSSYNLGFLGIKDPILETELETRLVEKVKHFLLEMLCKPLHKSSYANKFIMQSDLN